MVKSPMKRRCLGDVTNVPQNLSPRKPKQFKCISYYDDKCNGIVLDENTGCFISIIPEEKVEEEENPAPMTNHSDMILDEKTGCFVSHDSIDFDSSNSFDLHTLVDRVLELEEVVRRQQAELDRRKGLIEATEKEILEEIIFKLEWEMSGMREDLREKEEVIEAQRKELLELTNSGEFGKKLDAMRKLAARMEEKLENDQIHFLSPRQIQRLRRNSSRGMKWTMGEIRDGLILKMKCGTSGYSAVVTLFPILPSVRTLQESVQCIRFDNGFLNEVFDMLEVMGKSMPNIDRDCQIVFDEMQIEPTPKYDLSLKKWTGYATLPTHEGTANKALLFILAGIATRWKISVCVEFTNHKDEASREDKMNNPTGVAYKTIIDGILLKSESVGLRVSNITSDMGPDNLACWRAYGVKVSKTQVTSSFQNPVRPSVQTYLLPDVVHLMKNTKSMMESNGIIILPDDVVKKENLSSPEVNYEHIEDLYEFESTNELKIAFRLRPETIRTKKHFKKMNVGTAKSIICHRTGVGLKVLAREKNDSAYETTSWFIILLNTFFALATARHKGLAISKHNLEVYNKAIALIQQVSHIFANMKVGKTGNWKPVQRGMVVLCHGLLRLVDYFLVEQNYDYVMLGRFSSDCIENLFSVIRLRQPTPNASQFLQQLKVITLAQYSQYVKGSSYECEDGTSLSQMDFLEVARKRALERAHQRFCNSLEELMANPVEKVNESDFETISDLEKSVLYDMAGSVVAGVQSSYGCDICLNAVMWKGQIPHPASIVTELKEFTLLKSDNTGPLQVYVSDAVFKAILSAEITFRRYREKTIKLKATDVHKYFVENVMYVWNGSHIPNCHNLGRKILDYYFDSRLKEHPRSVRQKEKESERIQRSSKSVAMRQAANQMVS